jgi:hypothetical protein
MYAALQLYAASKLDPMSKMWVSFIGMGLMVFAALLISFARSKTKGWVKIVLTIVAFVMLVYGMLCGILAIF